MKNIILCRLSDMYSCVLDNFQADSGLVVTHAERPVETDWKADRKNFSVFRQAGTFFALLFDDILMVTVPLDFNDVVPVSLPSLFSVCVMTWLLWL